MTCTSPTQQPTSLEEATERAICWATHSLSLQGRSMLDAIWWLSTHLTASDRVLHGALARRREYRESVVAQRRRARDIQRSMWALDRHLTGDGRFTERSTAALAEDLRRAVRDYAKAELVLLRALERYSDDATRRALADEYARAVRHAPTRAHPLMHRSPVLRSALFRLEAVVDHARDVMDSRHVPIEPARAARSASRWDHYVTGAPAPAAVGSPPTET